MYKSSVCEMSKKLLARITTLAEMFDGDTIEDTVHFSTYFSANVRIPQHDPDRHPRLVIEFTWKQCAAVIRTVISTTDEVEESDELRSSFNSPWSCSQVCRIDQTDPMDLDDLATVANCIKLASDVLYESFSCKSLQEILGSTLCPED